MYQEIFLSENLRFPYPRTKKLKAKVREGLIGQGNLGSVSELYLEDIPSEPNTLSQLALKKYYINCPEVWDSVVYQKRLHALLKILRFPTYRHFRPVMIEHPLQSSRVGIVMDNLAANDQLILSSNTYFMENLTTPLPKGEVDRRRSQIPLDSVLRQVKSMATYAAMFNLHLPIDAYFFLIDTLCHCRVIVGDLDMVRVRNPRFILQNFRDNHRDLDFYIPRFIDSNRAENEGF